MSLHAINEYTFEFWRGESPGYVVGDVETFSRAGTKGTAAKLRGKRGKPFACELEAWTNSFLTARVLLTRYFSLIGAEPARVIWNELNLLALYRTNYLVTNVVEVNCQANVRLLGPGINYPNGASLVTRWELVPIYME